MFYNVAISINKHQHKRVPFLVSSLPFVSLTRVSCFFIVALELSIVFDDGLILFC
jgi:hypothetical protein